MIVEKLDDVSADGDVFGVEVVKVDVKEVAVVFQS